MFGGDFRQVLPVVPRATCPEMVDASLVKSYLWPQMCKLQLSKNMRAQEDVGFSDFLLRFGNGKEPTNGDGLIQIPSTMTIQYKKNEVPSNTVIEEIFPRLKE